MYCGEQERKGKILALEFKSCKRKRREHRHDKHKCGGYQRKNKRVHEVITEGDEGKRFSEIFKRGSKSIELRGNLCVIRSLPLERGEHHVVEREKHHNSPERKHYIGKHLANRTDGARPFFRAPVIGFFHQFFIHKKHPLSVMNVLLADDKIYTRDRQNNEEKYDRRG